ncbi:MAG: hypothetical protein M3Z98_00535 [Candidatus Dormibacteraeota bacterium]|nr:hypothetical protein [Candidatus Dormibacteraeota bacterium]
MKRTLIVFFGLVAIVFVFDQVSRRLLGLDCLGPVLPAWGCLAEPYPTTFGAAGDLSSSLLIYGGVLGGAFIGAYLVRDLVFGGVGYLLGRYRPDLVKKMAGGDEEPPSYRIR